MTAQCLDAGTAGLSPENCDRLVVLPGNLLNDARKRIEWHMAAVQGSVPSILEQFMLMLVSEIKQQPGNRAAEQQGNNWVNNTAAVKQTTFIRMFVEGKDRGRGLQLHLPLHLSVAHKILTHIYIGSDN